MTTFIIRRLLLLPIIVLGVSLIIFSLFQILGPNRLLASYVNPNVFDKLSEAELDALMEK